MDEIITTFVHKLNNRISEEYDIDINILNYYWSTLNNKCQYVYIQGEKKDCRCTNNIKKIGHKYCNMHAKLFSKVILKKHIKTGKLWHPNSKLVFDKGLVIGMMKNDILCELDEKGKSKCIRYNFKYKNY